MLAGLTAIATDSMFSFPTERMEHSLYLLLMGGIILGCYANLQHTTMVKTIVVKKNLLFVAIGVILFNLFLGIKMYNFEKHWKMAQAYKNSGLYREAIEEVEAGKNAFITTDISGAPIEIFSTGSYKELKNYDLAFKEIRRAAKYNPNDAKVYNEWGTIYSDQKQFDKAIELYNKALKLTPEFDIVLKNLAVAYYFAGNYAGCIETLDKIKIEGDKYLMELLSEAKRIEASDKK